MRDGLRPGALELHVRSRTLLPFLHRGQPPDAVDEHSCVLHTGPDSLDELALYSAVKGFDFRVLDPPELVPVVRALSDHLRRAADDSGSRTDSAS